jgi:hypothetical protein
VLGFPATRIKLIENHQLITGNLRLPPDKSPSRLRCVTFGIRLDFMGAGLIVLATHWQLSRPVGSAYFFALDLR